MNLPARAKWIGVNVLFAAFHPWLTPVLPAPAKSLAISAVLFLLPAAGWNALFGPATRALGMGLARDVAISTSAFLGLLVVFRFASVTPTDVLAWNSMWLVTNLGFLLVRLAGRRAAMRRSLGRREIALGSVIFFACYALYYYGATRVVPPQSDHDLEVQATGYGLLTRFEPLLLTDRHTIYYFAHPPLLHLYVAGSFLYHGSFRELEFFDAASRRARDAKEGRPVIPPGGLVVANRKETLPYRVATAEGANYLLVPEHGGSGRRVPAEDVELALITRRYEQHPHPLETRAPNLFLASATVTLLGIWAGRISRRWPIGLLAALAYATSPEIFVRSSYGGYFAIGTFASALVLLAVEKWRRRPTWHLATLPVLSGALAALSDHKMVLLPMALGIQSVIAWLHQGRQRHPAALFSPVVVGFALGTILFWCFGLTLAPAAFIEDHLHNHLLDRLTHQNPLGYGGYPTAAGLWLEFARHTGYVLLPVGVLLMVCDVFRSWGSPSRYRAPSRDLWLLWTLLTAAIFSVVDWRMTKHVVTMLLPLHLGLIPNRKAPAWRTIVPVLTLLFVLAWNAYTLRLLIENFDAFTVTPAW